MNSLSSPLSAQIAASQSGWCELFDFYLKSAISTPWGTVSILRLTDLPNGFSFFTPKISPEDPGNFGVAQAYQFWPIKRAVVKGDAKFTADKMQISASNVTTDWAAMLASIDWYDTPVIIRKVSTTITSPTADDCAIIWSGMVDACKVTERTLTFECSSDLTSLSVLAPRENMHTNCRFAWADDQCTAIRFAAANYKAKTVGSASTTTVIKSSDLTEDSASGAAYGTDLIAALSAGAITASSEDTGNYQTNLPVTVKDMNGQKYVRMPSNNHAIPGAPVTFGGTTRPSPLGAGTYYMVANWTEYFQVSATPGGSVIPITSNGVAVTITSTLQRKAALVQAGAVGNWRLGNSADWGTLSQGFYLLPDAQAGLYNAAAKPYIQFDFGSAVSPTVWRAANVPNVGPAQAVRLIAIFSSPDASTWTFETFFAMNPLGGIYYDLLWPGASSARYWRLCIRSRWAEADAFKNLLWKVSAYAGSRHYWASGRVRFDPATTTVALRGLSRRVLESYSGQVVVPALPVAPVSGDTFIIERGCPRTFNACAARNNWSNFGGFLDLPYQSVIR